MSEPANQPEPTSGDGHRVQVQRTQVISMSQQVVGPLPAPDMLERYNQIVPGAAERIISFADREQQHRHQLERQIVSNYQKESRIGAWGALIVALAMTGLAAWLIFLGQYGLAVTLLVSGVVAFFGAAVFRMVSDGRESRDSKA